MTAKKGIKLFSEVPIAATIKEFKHLDEGVLPVKYLVIPTYPYLLTQDQHKKVMNAMNLIEVKPGRIVNISSLANVSKQKLYLKYVESIFPTTHIV